MKKFLSILAAVGLTATASTAVVACTSIHNVAKDSLDADGNVFYKTKNKLRVANKAKLTKSTDEPGYYEVDSTEIGNNKQFTKIDPQGIAVITTTENDDTGDSMSSQPVVKKAKFYLSMNDVKSSDIDKDNKLTKELDTYVYVMIPHGTKDADGNVAGHAFYEQQFSWTIVGIKGGTIDSYVEASQIDITATKDPAINGAGEVSTDGKTITIYGKNLFKYTDFDKSALTMEDGISVKDADIENGNIVITLDGTPSKGNHTVTLKGTANTTVCDLANTATFDIA